MNDAEIQKEIDRLQAEQKRRVVAQVDVVQDHIDKAKSLTPTGTAVRAEAFREMLQAFELLYSELKTKGVFENENKKSTDS